MKRKKLYEFASAKKNLEKITIDKFEMAETKNHIDVSYILASSVANLNGALMTAEELEKAKDSILHQPLIIVPDWDMLPTGHSLSDFPKLSYDALVIGTHIESEVVEEDGIAHLKTKARVWKIRYPEVASTMVSLHEAGSLKFSMECSFESQTIEGSTRTLNGVNFIGSAVVDDPANPFSYALEVANKNILKKEEKIVTFEQAMELLKNSQPDSYVLIKQKIDNLSNEVSTKVEEYNNLKSTSDIVSDSLEKANTKIDELENDLQTMKSEKAAQELSQKQETRFASISEFIDFEEEEVAAKKEAFGKMDEDTFNLVLETAKRNKKEESKNYQFASDMRLEVTKNKGFLDGLA